VNPGLIEIDDVGIIYLDGPAIAAGATGTTTAPAAGKVYRRFVEGGVFTIVAGSAFFSLSAICVNDSLVVEVAGIDLNVPAAMAAIPGATAVTTVGVEAL
jgi:hypothetical protein